MGGEGAVFPAVLGWQSPWGGDDNDPIPRSYWLWYRLYRWTRQAKHVVGWHDWRAQPLGGSHCDWCGANRPLPVPVAGDGER